MTVALPTAAAVVIAVAASLGGGGLGSGAAVSLFAARGSALAAPATPPNAAPPVVLGHAARTSNGSVKLSVMAQTLVASRQAWANVARQGAFSVSPKDAATAEMHAAAAEIHAAAVASATALAQPPIAVTTSGTPVVASSAGSSQ